MDRELLEDCLAEGMSLEAIGKRVGKHESTIGHWLKKYGLAAAKAEKHALKGAPSKEEMERLLAAGLSLRRVAEELDRSLATIRHWMSKYGLKPAPRRKKASEHGPREMPSVCKQHGSTLFVREGSCYYRCKRCRYDRCQKVLEFHHLDPDLKAFQLSHNGATRSLAKSRAEARKCILLCANCHREVEAGIRAVPLNSVPDAVPG